jgi:hypothetical protein
MQIEREPAGDVMRDNCFVHMHRTLRPSGRAAREVKQSHVFGARPHGLEDIRRLRQGGGQIDRARRRANLNNPSRTPAPSPRVAPV